ncbi:unnamed protein product [Rotaria sordida]|uniref:Uncharacterized protein n=1 Tax=Rotaria sordida TaxID=392033 RepID=A0A818Y1Q7_9BILA|nr:unnamed protein product [Rotaria sordida]
MLLASINIFGIEGKMIGGDKARLSQTEIDQDSHEHIDSSSDKMIMNTQQEAHSVEPTNQFEIGRKLKQTSDVVNNDIKSVPIIYQETQSTTTVPQKVQQTSDKDTKVKPVKKKSDRKLQKPMNESLNNKTVTVKNKKSKKISTVKPNHKIVHLSKNRVHVSGNIVLVKHHSSNNDSVEYYLDNGNLTNSNYSLLQSRIPFTENFIANQSRVTLYVSTSKKINRKLAFSKFHIKIKQNYFPLKFHIHVKLTNLTHNNITLYFFVYITNGEKRSKTFIPAGSSQIHLQGTNRLSQQLDIHIKANGTEITGLFRGRYSQRYIRSGTYFQVFIIPEQSLPLRYNQTFDSIAQLKIKNVPSMYPVKFSLLVLNHLLKSNINYYAIAYIVENNIRRLINQEPILIINEKQILITSQVTFNVIPSSFILHGTVIRSMSGSFILQPRSSLILRLHEIDSDSRDIIFKLSDILTLPRTFHINISQSIRFDSSKNYDISALIIDEKNTTYMASPQPITLVDDFSGLILPVDDLLYYVQVRLHSSTNEKLHYIPGSRAQIFVTESPDMLIQPIFTLHIDSLPEYFHEFSFQIPVTAIQHDRNYYLVIIIDMKGIITHVSKSLLISNKQPPPLIIQLPVSSINIISGMIFDIENRPAQWSLSSYVSLILIDDTAEHVDRAIVQVWNKRLEKDFPIHFEIELDFNRLHSNHIYRLHALIKNERNILEYEPAGSILVLNPHGGTISDIRIPVHNIKKFQLIEGLIYINDINEPLQEKSEIILQLSSSPSLTHPNIINETNLKVDGRHLPINFTLNLPLNKIDINSVYYFLARYVVHDSVIIPASQAFAFSPRNEKPIILILSKTPQISITGQVTSTDGPFMLPSGSLLHLYITNNSTHTKRKIYDEIFLRASSNNLYNFRMNIDSDILQQQISLYLHADILYDDKILISIPKPALLQITSSGEWNINLVVDLPTLLVGEIISMNEYEIINGELDVYIQILERNTTNIVYKTQLRLNNNLPQSFRIELDNELFVRYSALQARALIKNCKGQILFDADGTIKIHKGLNVNINLPVVLTDRKKLNELQTIVDNNAPLHIGTWRLSVTGVVTDATSGTVTALEKNYVLQKS